MKNRIAEIRKHENLTQEEFAKKLGLSRNYIWMIENGQRVPPDRTIADICRVFNVNEVWLRTGIGEPFAQQSNEEKIAAILSQAIGGASTSRDRLIRALARLPEDAFPIIEKFILDAAESIPDEKKE